MHWSPVRTITIRRPDDWHVHLRDGESLYAVLPFTAKQYYRALVMPNTVPPITNFRMADAYRNNINVHLAHHGFPVDVFKPLMTLYLTDDTTPEDIRLAKEAGSIVAAKLYPANATTNSASGVTDIKRLKPVFEKMAEVGLVLSIHGETLVSKTYGDATRNGRVGQLRREAVFLKETAEWLVEIPDLRIVLEHITTTEAVEFVENASLNVAATITAHHLLVTLDEALESHHYKCMPILKEEQHRQALLYAATGGNPKFFGGTDSAPHARYKKETACGCAGCFTGLHALELYATAFEQRNALDRLEDFLSSFGADFYGLERSTKTITLRHEEWLIPEEIPFGDTEMLVPFWAGKKLQWKFVQEAT
jgi:dihydroorotase